MAVVNGFTAERMLEIEASTVVSGEVDVRGDLILRSRDGTPFNAGEVRGAEGERGASWTESSSPPVSLVDRKLGDFHLVNTSGDIYKVAGTTTAMYWELIGTFQGPEGSEGPEGPQGPPGTSAVPESRVFNFSTPLTVWECNHGLDSSPVDVITLSAEGVEIHGDVEFVNPNVVRVHWYYATAGSARIQI